MAKEKILVVDDETQILSFMKEMFVPRGYDVVCVGDGKEALKLAVSNQFSLMLLDLNLPGMSGVEILKNVRSGQPKMKVVVLTALDGLRDQVESIGCEYFLSKPFDMEELSSVVQDVLSGRIRKKQEAAEGMVVHGKILVVDDEKEIADFIKEDLQEDSSMDMQVNVAYSGEEALKKAEKDGCDIALVDIKLSRGSMWGSELIEKLKALPKPPAGFIIITAVDTEKQKSIAKQFPDYPIFDKPMSMTQLKDSIRRICQKQGLVRKVSAKKAE